MTSHELMAAIIDAATDPHGGALDPAAFAASVALLRTTTIAETYNAVAAMVDAEAFGNLGTAFDKTPLRLRVAAARMGHDRPALCPGCEHEAMATGERVGGEPVWMCEACRIEFGTTAATA